MDAVRYRRRPIPPEVITYWLCSLYHCRPSELGSEDWRTMLQHLQLRGMLADISRL